MLQATGQFFADAGLSLAEGDRSMRGRSCARCGWCMQGRNPGADQIWRQGFSWVFRRQRQPALQGASPQRCALSFERISQARV